MGKKHLDQANKARRSHGVSLRAGRWLPVFVTAVLVMVSATKWTIASRTSAVVSAEGSGSTSNSKQPELPRGQPQVESPVAVQDGIWSVADSIWSFENHYVSSAQLSAELRRIPAGSNRIESAAPEHVALLDMVPLERATVEQVESMTIRSIDFGTVRASIYYRETNHQPLIFSAKVANQIDADRWQVITLAPRRLSRLGQEHLLPLGGVVQGLCQRLSRSGSLQCEMLETTQTIGELLRNWQAAGWLVQVTDAIDPTSSLWSCSRGNQVIQVRATAHTAESKLTLVLTAIHSL